ncbi:MAG: hypothetical protein ACI4K6_01590 [Candidatus Fimenecus sp.]
MTQFFKNGLVGILGYLAAEAVMMVGSFFFADGPHSRTDCMILGIVYLVSLAAAFAVGQWRGKQFESRLKTVLSVLALPAVFLAYPLLLAVIFNAQWVMIPLTFSYLPGNFLCMATDYGLNEWYLTLCMIGAPLCILLATAVGALFSYDTAE